MEIVSELSEFQPVLCEYCVTCWLPAEAQVYLKYKLVWWIFYIFKNIIIKNIYV